MLLAMAPVIAPRAGEIQVPSAPDNPAAVLPPFEGHYGVGVRSYYWVDETRSKSGLDGDDGQRGISVTAWYPAVVERDERPALYAPGTDKILAAVDDVPEKRKRFIMAHEPLLNVAANAVPAAQAVAKKDGWPVILFSPGGNVSLHFQTALAERLASRGFVFIAMSHPYSSLDVSPDSGFTMSLEWDLDNEDRQVADENDNRLAGVLADDAAFVLARLRDLPTDDEALGPVMDLEQVGIAGHSRGGKTVGRACSTNPDYRACAVLDNIGPARERMTGIDQPFLTLRSAWDDARVAELHDYLGRTGSVAHDVVLENSNHFSCTDIPLFVAEVRLDGVDPASGIESCASILEAFFATFLTNEIAVATNWLPTGEVANVMIRRFQARAGD